MRTVYVKLDILGLVCVDDNAEVTMKARGTVEILRKKTKWEADFTNKWVVKFERELDKQHNIANEISNTLGRINMPFTRTFTYDTE